MELYNVSSQIGLVANFDDKFLPCVGISFAREIYVHSLPDGFTTGVTLYVASLTKPLDTAKDHNDILVPPAIPNAKELQPDDPIQAIACVFVGMTLKPGKLAETRGLQKQLNEASKKRKRGLAAADLHGDVEAIFTDPQALRVVAKKNGKTACFYALVNPDYRGLCTGVLVPGEDVFFFQCVRDDNSSSTQSRKDTFGAKIRDLMAGHDSGEDGPAYAAIKKKAVREEEERAAARAKRDAASHRALLHIAAGASAHDDHNISVRRESLMNILALLTSVQKTRNLRAVDLAVQLIRDLEKPEQPIAAGLFHGTLLPPSTEVSHETCTQVYNHLSLLVPSLIEEHALTLKELEFVLEGVRRGNRELRYDQIEHYYAAFLMELRRLHPQKLPEQLGRRELNQCCLNGEDAIAQLAKSAAQLDGARKRQRVDPDLDIF